MSLNARLWFSVALTALAVACTGSRKGLQGGREDPLWGGGNFNSSSQFQTGQPEMGSVRKR